MPKLKSPFVREIINGDYVVTDKIEEGMEWVFENKNVACVEKLDGTNVSLIIEKGKITRIFNRTAEIPFFNKGKSYIIQGVLNAFENGYCNFTDGQYFGELIGPKLNGNPHNLTEHIWIPFNTYARKHLAYKSWGKYPTDFNNISSWFKDDLFSLFYRRRHREVKKPEGVVFHNLDTGEMAKLRCDMFDWYKGRRHQGKPKKEE